MAGKRITDIEFEVWFDGEEWNVRRSDGLGIIATGQTPVSAMIAAEASVLRSHK